MCADRLWITHTHDHPVSVLCRSQYFWFFNCPVLPEVLNSANDYEYLDYHLVTGPMGARTKGAVRRCSSPADRRSSAGIGVSPAVGGRPSAVCQPSALCSQGWPVSHDESAL